jgi:hypothetical protein
MGHISKRTLNPSFSEALFKQLARTLADSAVSKERAMLVALLTDTERTMLAKRLALVYLIRQRIPEHVIVTTLKVSRSTVYKLRKDYEKGRFEPFGGKKRTMSREEREEFWRKVGKILRMGMPPMAGDERKYWMNRHFGEPVPKKRHRR